MKKYLVIYYDGNEMKAMLKECEFPDSSMPHVWGLPDNYSINAVIDGVKSDDFTVWIDEQVALDSND